MKTRGYVIQAILLTFFGAAALFAQSAEKRPRLDVQQYTITATQTLYNGFQTANRTRQAEGQVSAGRETLRLTELNLLRQAATTYVDLLRDAATLELNKSNVVVLQEQLRQSRDRFNVGEVTKTDVAQAESRLAAGRSQPPSRNTSRRRRHTFRSCACSPASSRRAHRSTTNLRRRSSRQFWSHGRRTPT